MRNADTALVCCAVGATVLCALNPVFEGTPAEPRRRAFWDMRQARFRP